jgi:hypothetical protein
VVLATPWPEEHRLRAGRSYEPPTFYEANDAAVALPEVFEEMQLPDGRSNKGRVQAFDGPIYIADAALYLMKADPSLGIKDPYELNTVPGQHPQIQEPADRRRGAGGRRHGVGGIGVGSQPPTASAVVAFPQSLDLTLAGNGRAPRPLPRLRDGRRPSRPRPLRGEERRHLM